MLPETRVWLIPVAVLGLFAAVITAASAQEPMADDELARHPRRIACLRVGPKRAACDESGGGL